MIPSIIVKLKNSLSKALMHFQPLTDKLTWSPDSNKFEITHDIIGQSSTAFIEAEYDEYFSLLVKSDVHDMRVFGELVLNLRTVEYGAAMEVVSVQVTAGAETRGGGLGPRPPKPHKEAEASQLLGENGLAFAAEMIQSTVRRTMKDPLKDCNAWPVWLVKTKEPSWATINVGSSPKFMKYETDFGWGKQERIEHVHRDMAGMLVLEDARDEMGGFQVCMVLPHSQMDEFSTLFMN